MSKNKEKSNIIRFYYFPDYFLKIKINMWKKYW